MAQIIRVIALGIFVLATAALRQPVEAGELAPGGEVEKVKQALTDFFDAAAQGDWKRIDQMLSDDFVFFTDDTVVLTRADFIEAMKDDSMQIQSLELSDVDVVMSSGASMALVRYRVRLESTVKGEPYNMVSAETVVYKKEGASWRMAHNHASMRILE